MTATIFAVSLEEIITMGGMQKYKVNFGYQGAWQIFSKRKQKQVIKAFRI